MTNTASFLGFSFIRGFGPIHDIDLVNQDLLNHINTRKGEKVMDPEFGCIVHDLLFELKRPGLVSDIQQDIRRIINLDPRVQLRKIEIVEQEYGYIGVVELFYNHLATVGQLQLKFENNQNVTL